MHLFVGQMVQRVAVGVARVDAQVDAESQTFPFVDCLLHEPQHALRRMHLPLPQDGVQEAVSQAMSLVHAVVVAGHRVTGDQRMINGVFIVTVICGAGLVAMHKDGEAVDVDGDLPRGMVASLRAEVPLARIGQRIAQSVPVAGFARENVEQSRLRGLAGHSFVERSVAGPVPGRHLHGRIVRHAVGVVLRRVSGRQRIDPLAQQFD